MLQGMPENQPGRMIRVGSEQHFVTDQPQHHLGPPCSGPQRPYSPATAVSMPRCMPCHASQSYFTRLPVLQD